MEKYNKNKLKTLFIEGWKNLSLEDKVKYSNEYRINNDGDREDIIYDNDNDFFEDNFPNKAEVARAISFGAYKWSDEYVWFNAYGNVVSSSYAADIPLVTEDLLPQVFDYFIEKDIYLFEEIIDCEGMEDAYNEYH